MLHPVAPPLHIFTETSWDAMQQRDAMHAQAITDGGATLVAPSARTKRVSALRSCRFVEHRKELKGRPVDL